MWPWFVTFDLTCAHITTTTVFAGANDLHASYLTYLATEFVDSLGRDASTSQGGESEEPGVIPVLYDSIADKLLDLPFGDYSVV